MRRKKLLRAAILCWVVAAIASFSLMGCLGIDTPHKKLLLADQTFTTNLERYNLFYTLQTPEFQTDLKARVDPIWMAGDNALDAWALAMAEGMPIDEKIEAFRLIKDQLLILLIEYGFKMEVE